MVKHKTEANNTEVMNDKAKTLAIQIGGDHYQDYAIQPFEFIHQNNLGFAEGCVIKYLLRHKHKGGAEDLKKAKHYIDLILASDYGQ